MTINEPYYRYSQIDNDTASYICMVAGVEDVRDLALMEINSFMTDMEEWYKDVQIFTYSGATSCYSSSIHDIHLTTSGTRLMDETESYCEVYDFNSIRSFILEEKGEWSLEDQVRIDMLKHGLNPHCVEDVHTHWFGIINNYGV